MSSAWIGLGSNQGQPATHLAQALQALQELSATRVVQASNAYLTPPWGLTDQDDFLNAVAELATDLLPLELLDAMLKIEADFGRIRDGRRWGPRTLDLDLLTYGGLVVDSLRLTLPHPRLHERAFVLIPLNALRPDLEIPGRGPVQDLLKAIPLKERADIKPSVALNYHRGP